MKIIITRHPAMVALLVKRGLVDPSTPVLAHASASEVQGKHVFGVLPHSLSCLAASFTEIPLRIPAELRGKELSLDEMEAFAGEPVTYTVSKVASSTV